MAIPGELTEDVFDRSQIGLIIDGPAHSGQILPVRQINLREQARFLRNGVTCSRLYCPWLRGPRFSAAVENLDIKTVRKGRRLYVRGVITPDSGIFQYIGR